MKPYLISTQYEGSFREFVHERETAEEARAFAKEWVRAIPPPFGGQAVVYYALDTFKKERTP